jgi:hypothetical protein
VHFSPFSAVLKCFQLFAARSLFLNFFEIEMSRPHSSQLLLRSCTSFQSSPIQAQRSCTVAVHVCFAAACSSPLPAIGKCCLCDSCIRCHAADARCPCSLSPHIHSTHRSPLQQRCGSAARVYKVCGVHISISFWVSSTVLQCAVLKRRSCLARIFPP